MRLTVGLGPQGPWCSLEAELPAELLEQEEALRAKVTKAFGICNDAMAEQLALPSPQQADPRYESVERSAAAEIAPSAAPACQAVAPSRAEVPPEKPLERPRRREDVETPARPSREAPARPSRGGQGQHDRGGFAPPKTGYELLDWMKEQPTEIQKKVKDLGRAWKLGRSPKEHWKVTEWRDDDVADVYQTVTGGSQDRNGWSA